MNEALQWAALIALGILVLGIFRQVALTLPPEVRATPSGPPIGHRLPEPALAELRRVVPGGELADGTLVAFVTESCVGCQRLLANLVDWSGRADGRPLVLLAKAPSEQFRIALLETGAPLIQDQTGELWKACEVSATPLVVLVDGDGRVQAKEVTHRVEGVATFAS